MEVMPVGIELHRIVIDACILAHTAAASRDHLLKKSPQLLAACLSVSWQFTQVHDGTLADLAFRIAPVLGETPVVVLLYRSVRPLPVFRYLADEHGGKGSDFSPNRQIPGGPTGGGKQATGVFPLTLFSRQAGNEGYFRPETSRF